MGLLLDCYWNVLKLAKENNIKELVFPLLRYGYGNDIGATPKRYIVDVAVNAVNTWLKTHKYPVTVYFCCYSDDEIDLYQNQIRLCLAKANVLIVGKIAGKSILPWHEN